MLAEKLGTILSLTDSDVHMVQVVNVGTEVGVGAIVVSTDVRSLGIVEERDSVELVGEMEEFEVGATEVGVDIVVELTTVDDRGKVVSEALSELPDELASILLEILVAADVGKEVELLVAGIEDIIDIDEVEVGVEAAKLD